MSPQITASVHLCPEQLVGSQIRFWKVWLVWLPSLCFFVLTARKLVPASSQAHTMVGHYSVACITVGLLVISSTRPSGRGHGAHCIRRTNCLALALDKYWLNNWIGWINVILVIFFTAIMWEPHIIKPLFSEPQAIVLLRKNLSM